MKEDNRSFDSQAKELLTLKKREARPVSPRAGILCGRRNLRGKKRTGLIYKKKPSNWQPLWSPSPKHTFKVEKRCLLKAKDNFTDQLARRSDLISGNLWREPNTRFMPRDKSGGAGEFQQRERKKKEKREKRNEERHLSGLVNRTFWGFVLFFLSVESKKKCCFCVRCKTARTSELHVVMNPLVKRDV